MEHDNTFAMVRGAENGEAQGPDASMFLGQDGGLDFAQALQQESPYRHKVENAEHFEEALQMRGIDEGDINVFDANQSLLMGGLTFDMDKSI